MVMVKDTFHYVGDNPKLKGHIVIASEFRPDRIFKYLVVAVPRNCSYFSIDGEKKTMYYMSWTGFLRDWRRASPT